MSVALQQLRMPLGAGLGGLVLETRRPYWATDYRTDPRFRHTEAIDTAVEEEGIVSICGTPLVVDAAFVGVLFASSRARRTFSREEVSLLGSLATLAAVTIVQVRAAAETEAALAQLSEAHTEVARAAAAHDRFAEIVLSGGDVDAITAALAELLGVWVILVDASGNELASCGAVDTDDLDRLLSCAAGSTRLERIDDGWTVAVAAKGERLGALVIGGVEALSAADQRIVERAAVVTALVLLFRLQAAEQSRRAQADLLVDSLTGADPTALADRVRLLGRRLPPHVLVAVCRGQDDAPAVLGKLVGRIPDRIVLTGVHDGATVLLLHGDDPSAAAKELAAALGHRAPLTVGAVGPVAWGHDLVAAHRQAVRVADALMRLGRIGEGAAPHDLGVAGLVGADDIDVAAHVEHVIGPVVRYDAQRRTDLLETLTAYFAAGQSPTRAAAALHVHPNTVQQRLDRVTELLGATWRQPARSLDIQVALRLHAVLPDRLTGAPAPGRS